jgi:RimJ/RimL family protein N-acetyltransferase
MQRPVDPAVRPVEQATVKSRPVPRWVPIRRLAARHRSRVLKHLLALAPADRYLRFGYQASDAQIERYVERIDFARDEVFGVFNRRLALIALAHLAYDHAAPAAGSAEFGVSVHEAARGRGFGARLFDRAVLHARNRGVDQLVIHALSENLAMLRIARNAGAVLRRDGSEAEGLLQLPPDDVASHVGQLMESRAAELDYQMKRQAQRLLALWRLLAGGALPA